MATAHSDARPLRAEPARAALAAVRRNLPNQPSYAAAQRRIRWPIVAALGIVHAAIVVLVALDTTAPQRVSRPDALVVALLPDIAKAPPPPKSPPRPLPVERFVPQALAEPPPVVPADVPRIVDLPAIALLPDPPRLAPAAPAIAPPAMVSVAPRADPFVAPRFDAAYLENPAPAYPVISRRRHEEGRVLLRVRVGADGRAESVEIATSSGYDRLDRAAQDAVRRWRFVPARCGAEAVAAFVNVPISFTLERS